jgi:hypothetical protein
MTRSGIANRMRLVIQLQNIVDSPALNIAGRIEFANADSQRAFENRNTFQIPAMTRANSSTIDIADIVTFIKKILQSRSYLYNRSQCTRLC